MPCARPVQWEGPKRVPWAPLPQRPIEFMSPVFQICCAGIQRVSGSDLKRSVLGGPAGVAAVAQRFTPTGRIPRVIPPPIFMRHAALSSLGGVVKYLLQITDEFEPRLYGLAPRVQ